MKLPFYSVNQRSSSTGTPYLVARSYYLYHTYMHLLHLLPELDALRAGLHTPAPNERWLTNLEQMLGDTLGQLETHRLIAASPTQLQEYFYLLEIFSQPSSTQVPLTQRRLLAGEALLLLESMALEREKAGAYSHECSWLLPAAASPEETLSAAEQQ